MQSGTKSAELFKEFFYLVFYALFGPQFRSATDGAVFNTLAKILECKIKWDIYSGIKW
jgi:hypothetical protein